jgi:hypothetical protein
MIAETSFIINHSCHSQSQSQSLAFQLLKHEAIDRLDSVVDDLPKYKQNLQALIVNFEVDNMLYLMNIIHRDSDFKASAHYPVYNKYFDEIEELIHKNNL